MATALGETSRLCRISSASQAVVDRVSEEPAGIFLLDLHVAMEAHTQEATAAAVRLMAVY